MVDSSSSCWTFLLQLYCSTVCLPKHQSIHSLWHQIFRPRRAKNSKYSPRQKSWIRSWDQRETEFRPENRKYRKSKIRKYENTLRKKMHVRLFSDERTKIGALSIAQKRSSQYYNSRDRLAPFQWKKSQMEL